MGPLAIAMMGGAGLQALGAINQHKAEKRRIAAQEKSEKNSLKIEESRMRVSLIKELSEFTGYQAKVVSNKKAAYGSAGFSEKGSNWNDISAEAVKEVETARGDYKENLRRLRVNTELGILGAGVQADFSRSQSRANRTAGIINAGMTAFSAMGPTTSGGEAGAAAGGGFRAPNPGDYKLNLKFQGGQ